jgi:glycosyltransferase involved in cell wall biosynthesis
VVYLGHGEMFAREGWAIDWFAMKHPDNPGTDETHFADLIDLAHMPGKMDKLRAAASIVYNRNARGKIAGLLAERRPDIAHLHNIYHHLSPSILGELRRQGVPVVLTAHDLKLACPSYKMLSAGSVCEACKGGRIWNVAVKRCLKGSRALSGLIAVETAVHRWLDLYGANVDRLVAPSQFYRDKLVEWGWPAEKLVYIPTSPALWPESPVPERGRCSISGDCRKRRAWPRWCAPRR